MIYFSQQPGDYSNTGTLQSQAPSDLDYRGRPRRRRDFFGTIKRKLGKSRSKSVGPENDATRDDSLNRSVSADRTRNDEGRIKRVGARDIYVSIFYRVSVERAGSEVNG